MIYLFKNTKIIEEKDTYRTIETSLGNILYKEKGSKFIAFLYPISNEEEVKTNLENLKKEHYAARHWSYAYRIGIDKISYRVNDDGEPANSAGQPIYGQILAFDVTNILIVVVRYFGGTKLGIGGLINAYRTTTKLGLEAAEIVTKTVNVYFKLNFSYEHLNKVMRIVKEQNLEILEQQMNLECEMVLSVRRKNEEKTAWLLDNLRCLRIQKLMPRN